MAMLDRHFSEMVPFQNRGAPVTFNLLNFREILDFSDLNIKI